MNTEYPQTPDDQQLSTAGHQPLSTSGHQPLSTSGHQQLSTPGHQQSLAAAIDRSFKLLSLVLIFLAMLWLASSIKAGEQAVQLRWGKVIQVHQQPGLCSPYRQKCSSCQLLIGNFLYRLMIFIQ